MFTYIWLFSLIISQVIIRHGELLSGILDKKQFGSTQYGLVHAVWDTHGAEHAISLLSSLAKLFTVYLQRVGFTLGVRDILVRQERDRKRTKIINKARRLGTEVRVVLTSQYNC